MKDYQQKEKLLKHLTAAYTAASVLSFRHKEYKKIAKRVEKDLQLFYSLVGK